MAIDSRAKRLSILGFAQVSSDLLTDPAVSGVSTDERADFLNLYRGIALNNPAAVTASVFMFLLNQSTDTI